MHFADTLIARLRDLGHPLCAGLDPHLGLVPELFQRGTMAATDPETADVVESMLMAFLDRLVGQVSVIKPQIAFFEQLGSRGLASLERVVAAARERELMILLDAKRGDIDTTAEAYAKAYLDPGAPCEVDAVTLNPYLGFDTLVPWLARAREQGRGLFVLVHTSNPGAGDLQERVLEKGTLFYEAVAESLAPLTESLAGPATGWSSLGVVAGATYPEQAERLRTRLPQALFLVPGYGGQGATAEEAVRSFVSGPAGREGGVVNSSRGLLFCDGARGAGSARSWDHAIDEAIKQTCGELSDAVAR